MNVVLIDGTPTMVRHLMRGRVWHVTADGYNTLCRQRIDGWPQVNARSPVSMDLPICRVCRQKYERR